MIDNSSPNTWATSCQNRINEDMERCKAIKDGEHCPMRYRCLRYEVNPFHRTYIDPAFRTIQKQVFDENGKVVKDKDKQPILVPAVVCDNIL